jgi:hypothetical protein
MLADSFEPQCKCSEAEPWEEIRLEAPDTWTVCVPLERSLRGWVQPFHPPILRGHKTRCHVTGEGSNSPRNDCYKFEKFLEANHCG